MKVNTTAKRSIFQFDESKAQLNVVGDIRQSNTINGQYMRFKQVSQLFDIADAASITISTVTATSVANFVPANALILACTSRVIADLTGAATTWSIGVSGATTRYGTGLALTAGTTSDMSNHLVSVSPIYVATAVPIVFTSASGTWTGGKIRVTLHYLTVRAETS